MKRTKSGKLIAAAMIGNSLEFYDFTLFVFLAPILGPLFFPSEGEHSTGQAPWYPCRPIGRVQAALAPSLLALDALYSA